MTSATSTISMASNAGKDRMPSRRAPHDRIHRIGRRVGDAPVAVAFGSGAKGTMRAATASAAGVLMIEA